MEKFFLTFPIFSCGKMEKIIVPKGKNIFPNRTFFPNLENYCFQFFRVQYFKGTMKFQKRAISWGSEKIGNS